MSPNCTIVFGQNLVFQHKFCQNFVDFGTTNPNFVVLHKEEEEEEEEEENFLLTHSFIAEEEGEEVVAAFLVGSFLDVVGCDPLCEQFRV